MDKFAAFGCNALSNAPGSDVLYGPVLQYRPDLRNHSVAILGRPMGTRNERSACLRGVPTCFDAKTGCLIGPHVSRG